MDRRFDKICGPLRWSCKATHIYVLLARIGCLPSSLLASPLSSLVFRWTPDRRFWSDRFLCCPIGKRARTSTIYDDAEKTERQFPSATLSNPPEQRQPDIIHPANRIQKQYNVTVKDANTSRKEATTQLPNVSG